MTPRPLGQSGVTLTEVLIAMLVMALGLMGLFALFPLGLLNISRAVTHNRSEGLGRSALADLRVHNLLAPERYYFGQMPAPPMSPAPPFTPFMYDTATSPILNPPPAGYPFKPFPVAIDPIWLHEYGTAYTAAVGTRPLPPFPRLGRMDQIDNTTGLLQPDGVRDPNGLGLQRVIPTDGLDNDGDGFVDASDNMPPGGDGTPDTWPDIVGAMLAEPFLSRVQTDAVFGGRDDMVFREDDPSLPLPRWADWNQNGVIDAGELVEAESERNYTYLVTARLADVSDPRTYEIAIATFFKRDLGVFDPSVNSLVGGEKTFPIVILPDPSDATGQTPSNRVVVRWSIAAAEPDIRREGWFMDATYFNQPSLPVAGPYRGYWYHYVRASDPRPVDWNLDGVPDEMHVTLTLDRPARESTYETPPPAPPGITFNEGVLNPLSPGLVDGLDNNGNGLVDLEDFDPSATAVNVGLFIPGVVSVYEKTVRAE